MGHGTPYKNHIDKAILKLQEDGDLHKMKTTWWKRKRGGGKYQRIMTVLFLFIKHMKYKNKYIHNIYSFCFQIGKCAAAKKAGMAPPLGLPNVTGVFVVTIGGCALAT